MKEAGFHSLLETIMNHAGSADGPRQGLPLAAGAQDIEDLIQCGAVGCPRPPTFRLRFLVAATARSAPTVALTLLPVIVRSLVEIGAELW